MSEKEPDPEDFDEVEDSAGDPSGESEPREPGTSRRRFLGGLAAGGAILGAAGAASASPLKSRILARIEEEIAADPDGHLNLAALKDYYKADYSKGGDTAYAKDGYVKGGGTTYLKGGHTYVKADPHYLKAVPTYLKAVPEYLKAVPTDG